MHVVDDVATVHEDRRRSRRAKRHVEHRPVLGDVDAIAAEHLLDPFVEASGSGEREQSVERFAPHAVLRVVHVEPGRLRHESRAARRVGLEQGSQVNRSHFLGVGGEVTPFGKRGERCGGGRHRGRGSHGESLRRKLVRFFGAAAPTYTHELRAAQTSLPRDTAVPATEPSANFGPSGTAS